MLRKLLKGTGISFSWKRLLGLTGLRLRISRKLGFPTTRGGFERMIGRNVIKYFFKLPIILLIIYYILTQYGLKL